MSFSSDILRRSLAASMAVTFCNGPGARTLDSHQESKHRHCRPQGHTPRVKYTSWGTQLTGDAVYYGPVCSVCHGGSCCEVSLAKEGMSFTKKPSRDYQSPTGSTRRNRTKCSN
ncbi:hypothetical protein Taro_032367 [Colocasia esculenta]|uniref:Uncharacterized protein n=1 Tax=Colocasia esculenta TaxID=4460 RepID=A0A843W986_COLES|nr:hypothetical protein [Colocasia esculenta]